MAVADGSREWGAVTIRWARSAPVSHEVCATLATLGAEQVARLDALGQADAARFATGRMLIAHAIAATLGPAADPAISTVCERCGQNHGRVRHRAGEVALSVSYAGDLVVVASAHTAHSPTVGVDVEPDDDATRRRVAELAPLFPAAGAPSLRTWTRLEAVLKADGRGLRVAPTSVTIDERRGTATVPGAPQPFAVATIPGPPGIVLSAAAAPRAAAARS